jgi:hypothetical protein
MGRPTPGPSREREGRKKEERGQGTPLEPRQGTAPLHLLAGWVVRREVKGTPLKYGQGTPAPP